jgi:aromatic amino acid permease
VWWPEQVFKHLLNSVGAMLVFVWLAIAASQLVLRRRFEREDPERLIVRMWGFPYLTWFVLTALGAVCVLMLFDADARPQLLSSAVVVAIVLAFALVREARRRNARKRAVTRL